MVQRRNDGSAGTRRLHMYMAVYRTRILGVRKHGRGGGGGKTVKKLSAQQAEMRLLEYRSP